VVHVQKFVQLMQFLIEGGVQKLKEIIIDGNSYKFDPGQTVLEVARGNDIDIPTLCYSEHLSITGACRMCLVENKENGSLETACTLPARDGLEVETDNDKIYDARKTVLDLILSDHPMTCMTCEANGDCQLQDLAYQFDIEESSYGSKKEDRFELEERNSFIVYDPDKCILCGKCVRADSELQCSEAIEFSERGFKTKIAAAFDEGLGGEDSSCVFCGLCVENCPTAALSYKPARKKGREYELRKQRTTCGYCGVGCQVELNIKGNEVIKVDSVYEDTAPNPDGEMCVKGRFAYGFIDRPDRLKYPLIKRDGEFVESSWDEALDYIADNLSRIRDEHGGREIGALSSARCTNEENYIMQKFMRAVMKTNSVEHCARL